MGAVGKIFVDQKYIEIIKKCVTQIKKSEVLNVDSNTLEIEIAKLLQKFILYELDKVVVPLGTFSEIEASDRDTGMADIIKIKAVKCGYYMTYYGFMPTVGTAKQVIDGLKKNDGIVQVANKFATSCTIYVSVDSKNYTLFGIEKLCEFAKEFIEHDEEISMLNSALEEIACTYEQEKKKVGLFTRKNKAKDITVSAIKELANKASDSKVEKDIIKDLMLIKIKQLGLLVEYTDWGNEIWGC